jgi:hypothetical protein
MYLARFNLDSIKALRNDRWPEQWHGLKTLNYISRDSSYRAVNTMLAGSENLFLNVLKPTGYVMHEQFNLQSLLVT